MSDTTALLDASTVAAPTVDPDTIRTFLIGMYGFEAKGWLTPTRKIVSRGRTYTAAESVPAVDIDTAVDWLARYAVYTDTWCGVCPRGTKPPGSKRGGKRTVLSMPSVWLDVDYIDAGHKDNDKLVADLPSALAIVHAMPLAPTIIIATGGGVQAHWCFDALIQLDGAPPGFAQLAEAWVTFAQSLAGPGQVDSVGDLARMLRVPGTLNHKLDYPRPVTIIEADWTRRHTPEEFVAVIPAEYRQSAARRVGPKEVRTGSAPRVDAEGFSTGDLRPPITRYNESTDICELIEEDGASYAYTDAEERDHYARPGKDVKDGVSGNVLDGTLYNHSTNWVARGVELPPGPYDAAQYTIETRYGGDSRAAASVWGKEHRERDNEEFLAAHRRSGSRGDEKPVSNSKAPASKLELECFQRVRERRARWLWAGRTPLGSLTLLAGREGEGKSTIAIDIAARTTLGTLDGEYLGQPKDVVIIATEDSAEHTIKPRLMAAGADMDRVFRVNMLDAGDALSLPVHIPDLEAACAEHDVALIVLDPLLSRLDGRLDSHKDAEARRALEPLGAFLNRNGASVIGLIHLNKSGSTDPLQAIMASRAFTAFARSVLFAMVDPDDESRHLLGLVKSNLGPTDLPTLTYMFDVVTVGEDDGPIVASKIAWGSDSTTSVREALQVAPEDRSAVDEAAEWLRDWIDNEGGSGLAAQAIRDGKAAGHGERTVRRASDRLGVERRYVGFPRVVIWAWPGAPITAS